MDPYAAVLEEFFRLVCQLWLKRVEDELWDFAQALDGWLHELFARPRPDWRESFEQFLASQTAEGRTATPQSRQDLLDFLEDWSKTVDWNAVSADGATEPSSADHSVSVVAAVPQDAAEPPIKKRQRRPVGRFKRRRQESQLSAGEAFFLRKLNEAKQFLDAIEDVLKSLGQKLDAARSDETVDVESEVDAIEGFIWRYNDTLESARDTWLREDLGGDTYDRLVLLTTPAAFNLPLFADADGREGEGIERSSSWR